MREFIDSREAFTEQEEEAHRDAVQLQQAKHAEIRRLDTCVKMLQILEDDLLAVGLNKLADRLIPIASQLSLAIKHLDKIDAEETFAALREAEQGSMNVLRAALAGIEVEKAHRYEVVLGPILPVDKVFVINSDNGKIRELTAGEKPHKNEVVLESGYCRRED